MTDLKKVFVDSNILIYLIDDSAAHKKKIVGELLNPDFIISTQVISENVSVCLKKLKLDKQTTFDFAKRLLANMLEGKFELTLESTPNHLSSAMVLPVPSPTKHAERAITDCKIVDVFYPVREDYK